MNTWLPALTMGIGREETERQKEYLAAMEKLVVKEKRKLRDDTIEECARAVETQPIMADSRVLDIQRYIINQNAAAIRALKDKP